MGGCQESQIAIEKRRLDVLEAEAQGRLDHHLASCEACSRYARLAGQTEEIMGTITRDAMETVDWDRVESRVRQMMRQYSLSVPRMMTCLVSVSVLVGWVSGWQAAFFVSVLFLALWYALHLIGRARVGEAALSERTQGDLMGFYRLELDRRMASIRRANLVEFGVGAFLTIIAAFKISGLATFSDVTRGMIFQGICGVLLLGLGLYRRMLQLPRLKSERSELD